MDKEEDLSYDPGLDFTNIISDEGKYLEGDEGRRYLFPTFTPYSVVGEAYVASAKYRTIKTPFPLNNPIILEHKLRE